MAITGTWIQPLSIDAVGDDFVMLSGEWFEDASLAALVSQAEGVWAYATTSEAPGDAKKQMAAEMPCGENLQVYALAMAINVPIPCPVETGLLITLPRLDCAGGHCGKCCGGNCHEMQ